MLNEYRKRVIAKAVFATQYEGVQTSSLAIEDCATGKQSTVYNPLTQFLVDAFHSSEQQDDLENALEYAINQLSKARDVVKAAHP